MKKININKVMLSAVEDFLAKDLRKKRNLKKNVKKLSLIKVMGLAHSIFVQFKPAVEEFLAKKIMKKRNLK
ncbi:hypothetical protein BpHYR1_018184, partial [Brachionus plicatilis]